MPEIKEMIYETNIFLFINTGATDIEVYQMNGQLDTAYKYKYSNYKEFTVDTKINYDAID